MLGNCGTGNPIDDCWRCDPNWSNNRQRLADCAVGFGRAAIGGKDGKVYVVTDPSDNPANPEPGTLRYGIVQDEPLWITFARDMTIRPKKDLLVGSHKTIDGRGADVVVGDGGACFAVTKREDSPESEWTRWTWTSEGRLSLFAGPHHPASPSAFLGSALHVCYFSEQLCSALLNCLVLCSLLGFHLPATSAGNC
ncbi:hypothetical protein PR202_gb24465 [Eleusine coracana subsp. coracana]|uniref:Uncharacterized protein n=1 Tax=Eleusine coracana subsp. coracana TaxID=191504 RepID=A0AAV5FMM5_ELECO|nr:hypothetical protein PR202_gb24465 [Eleusine coracana subsp. coracana]